MTGEGWTTASLEAMPRVDGIEGAAGLVLVYSRSHRELPSVLCLTQSVHRIGREVDGAGDLRVPEGAVSRLHALLELRPDGVWVVDAGSTNGTLVNGVRVPAARLQEHDVVRIGDTVFRFAAHGAQDFAAYRIDGTVEASQRKHRPAVRTDLVGGHQIDALLARVEKVARTQLACVVTGESGTGKELLARTIHDTSERRGAYQAVNCAALPANLLESELFGYRRGAFTGATQDKPGLVRAAHGGTLFLDEVGDMPLEAQAKLLRVLQEREVLPLGSTTPERVDVRVVCATHRDLEAEVAAGRFRGDLLARLREFQVRLPPLRERREDMLRLTRAFLRRAERADANVSLSFMLALSHYAWPYNVRELESAVRLAVALSDGTEMKAEHLPESVRSAVRDHGRSPTPPGAPAAEPRPPVVAHAPAPSDGELRAICARHQGNVTAIARELGNERMQVHRWLKRYGIDVEQFRPKG
ncbi:MAG: sigma 54-interacting transcriptional regulator [Deltaproteobacteria bacterium]